MSKVFLILLFFIGCAKDENSELSKYRKNQSYNKLKIGLDKELKEYEKWLKDNK